MAGRQRSEDERLKEIEGRLVKLQKRADDLNAEKMKKAKRVADRRAFLVGQAILSHLGAGGPPIEALAGILDAHVKKTADRLVISDLLKALADDSRIDC